MHWIIAIAFKETRHIIRDWQTLGILLLLPVFMMFFFGYGLNADVENTPVVVIDPAQSTESRSITQKMDASSLFNVIAIIPGGNPKNVMEQWRAKAVVSFPLNFSKSIRTTNAEIQVLIDGSDPSTGTTIRNSVDPFFTKHVLTILNRESPEAVSVTTTMLYNPQQQSSLFFVPGLMATILLMVGALMTSISIAKERETGTLANVLTSPVKPMYILLGKVMPYFIIALIDACLILTVGQFVFDVKIQGNLGFLVIATLVYIFVALTIGIFISTVTRKQQHAMLVSLGATMMPTIMLSGFVFPITSMPKFLQVLSLAMPARWFLEIVRGVVLKGTGVAELWQPLLVLSLMFLALLAAAASKFEVQS